MSAVSWWVLPFVSYRDVCNKCLSSPSKALYFLFRARREQLLATASGGKKKKEKKKIVGSGRSAANRIAGTSQTLSYWLPWRKKKYTHTRRRESLLERRQSRVDEYGKLSAAWQQTPKGNAFFLMIPVKALSRLLAQLPSRAEKEGKTKKKIV
ncbi:hypothetical protein OUZ56_005078 [Daphnia magna]|uniref:Uncharacterized protein n=1 Tax=Daphnia magna TaxID=35525 RepID=A0ABQ9YRR4_9CRUS|nr:hypothetical protein OUZ56_005078 [Daphnia magna]